MGCSSCGGRAAMSNYPKEVKMPDGTVVTVTSAADERVKRSQVEARMRMAARGDGYTVLRR